jgi:hypothetical protein
MYGYTYGYPSGGGAGAVNGFESAVLSDGGTVVAIGNTTDLYSRLLGLGLINSASLVNSCNGGKADALYNFVPSPVQSLDRFTVTRASTKLRIGSDGLYGSVANNVPAFEFNTDGSYRGLLVEPGATNLALHSQDFTQGVWAKTVSASVTANTGIAPDGTMTADTFTAGADGSQIQYSFVASAGVTYTASFFIRRITGTGVVNIRSVENVNTPVVITSSWQRYSVTTTSTTTTIRIGMTLATNGDAVEIWQAQLETGSVATSPIVTTAGTASRVADSVTLASASSLIGQSAGTLYIEYERANFTTTGNTRLFNVSDGSTANRILFLISPAGLQNMTITTASSEQASISTGASIFGMNRTAVAYAVNDIAVYRNGSSVGTDASATIPACNRVNIGNGENGAGASDNFTGWIRSAVLFPTRLANATLTALTTL